MAFNGNGNGYDDDDVVVVIVEAIAVGAVAWRFVFVGISVFFFNARIIIYLLHNCSFKTIIICWRRMHEQVTADNGF